jgi:hypothetical protein
MKISLKVRQIRELQAKHGISNLLQPTAEDAQKMASIDVLPDLYFEGTRANENAPSREEIEELDLSELMEGINGLFNPGK